MIDTVTCPNCDAEDLRGARFCPHCGTGLGGNGTAPAVHAPLVRLLTEVADLQHELLRQFERAIAVQAEALQRTLDDHSRQSERLQAWQKWTAGLAAAAAILIVTVIQIS